MKHLIYKHKYGGKARISQITMKLGKETSFLLELLDENRGTIELTESEFHEQFKIAYFQFDFEESDNKPKNKEEALSYLKKMNDHVKPEHVVTKLYFNNGREFVQDFSYFANEKYMSKELLDALQNGQTLTVVLEKELSQFIIEKSI